MRHFVASVCKLDHELALGQIIPTDESHERLIEHADVLEFHVDEHKRWHPDAAVDPNTGDRRYLPQCFSPRQEIYAALDAAWSDAKDQGQLVGCHYFTMED